MSELHSWLSTQHHGLQTYKFLKQQVCLISGLHFRASPWLSEQTNAQDMRPHRVQFFYNCHVRSGAFSTV
jgi:hypothetical protein